MSLGTWAARWVRESPEAQSVVLAAAIGVILNFWFAAFKIGNDDIACKFRFAHPLLDSSNSPTLGLFRAIAR